MKVAGTLAVLDEADQAGLLDFDEAVDYLRKTSFRLSQIVRAEIQQKRVSLTVHFGEADACAFDYLTGNPFRPYSIYVV